MMIDKNITEVLTIFPKAIAEDKHLILKQLKSNSFKLVSKAQYEKVSMIEKEHFFISGEFIEDSGKTHINYQIKANATYRILAFLILPLMSLPTLAMGLASSKPNTEGVSKLQISLLIEVVLLVLAALICFSQEKKMKREGEKTFRNLMDRIY